jgi:FG-GAP-like repeat/Transmembrane protein 131-like N-terminal/FG-GAP repeat
LTLLVAALSLAASAQFETRSSSPVTVNPLSVAVADFNHDGKLDIAAAVNYTGQVAVLLGRGDGTFQPAVYYNINSQLESVESVAVADFNHDGNIDIAVADRLGQNISILLGNGDGTFQSPVQFPTSAQPTDVIVGDFNNDGNPDLAICDEPYVSVLLGNGDGTFQAPLDNTVTFCSQAQGSVAAGDLNGDHNLDIVFAGYGAMVLLGNGDGTFQPAVEYPSGLPQSVAISDFNRDGKPDLAVADYGGKIWIFLGNGDGTFQPGVPYAAGSFTAAVAAADLNDDGIADLVFLTLAQRLPWYAVTVMLGNGDGTFQPAVDYQTFENPSEIAVADVNGDHRPDLVIADYGGSAVDVLLNTGVVSFAPNTPLTFSAQFVGTTSNPKNVTLTNTGTATLSITSISRNKPFLLGSKTTCGTSVAPGANCTLSVIFEPTVLGLKTGLLVLKDGASTKPQVIELSGTGTTLTVSPAQLNFGSQKVGTKSAPQNVNVANTGHTAVSVTGVSITGSNYLDFSQTNTCGTQINPGASCTISVTFLPLTKGTRSAVAQINGPSGVVWQAVSITGTGT